MLALPVIGRSWSAQLPEDAGRTASGQFVDRGRIEDADAPSAHDEPLLMPSGVGRRAVGTASL
jgi:hypothetical protein